METIFHPDSSLASMERNYNDWVERIELFEGVVSHHDEGNTGRGTRDDETSSGAGCGLIEGGAEGKSGKSCKS
jgi:hypothetical protein